MTDSERLSNEINEVKIELANFTGRVTEWMDSTKNYRQDLSNQLDKLRNCTQTTINSIVDKLPCDKREIRLRKVEIDISNIKGKATVWGAAMGFIAGILSKLIIWK